MDDAKYIQSMKSLDLYSSVMEKLTVNPQLLSDDEKTYILTCAVILIKKYEKDRRLTSYIELAYYIILKYSLSFSDFEPLYDFCVNIGFYPIAQAITSDGLITFDNISSSLLPYQISSQFGKDTLVETLEQKLTRDRIIASSHSEISFIAPTSFGKSSIIIEHIAANKDTAKRVAIIVPTKSLLMQTYRAIRKANLGVKIIIHDEMFDGEERFVAVFTQERALRLLEKQEISFDILYIDEAHRLLERNSRSVLLSRLIKINHLQNENSRTIYLSPLISDTDNLKITHDQNIFEQRITFSIKEPEYYEYRLNGAVFKYNRFVDRFYEIDHCHSIFEYIYRQKTDKTFCYLYSPRKIEQFAKALSNTYETPPLTSGIREVIDNLKNYVHEDFYAIEFLKKGIIYLHGKIPDNIKEYLEHKFDELPEIHFLIANKVILEGINLPIDSLFILNGTNLHGKELTNLIGRVNRLDQVFGDTNNLSKLLPMIHFVNSEEYNRQKSKFENKIKLLKNSVFEDKVKNPLLAEFDFEQLDNDENEGVRKKCEEIIADEKTFFTIPTDAIQQLKHKMISLGMNTVYIIADDLCALIHQRMVKLLEHTRLNEIHFLDKLRYIFVRNFDKEIIDQEFGRLKNDQAIVYYKMFFDNRKKSLKENVATEVLYFQRRVSTGDSRLYIGESYGEIPYSTTGRGAFHNVYIDLRTKTRQQMANIAIVKQKLEEDFVSYKLHMFFQLMYDYGLLSKDEYHTIIYGTTDPQKLRLVKMGLTINIINRLGEDGQLGNISIDDNNNLYVNDAFNRYKQQVDDFYRFQLSKFL